MECAADVAIELLKILEDADLQAWCHAVDDYRMKYRNDRSVMRWPIKHIIGCLVVVWKRLWRPSLLLKCKHGKATRKLAALQDYVFVSYTPLSLYNI